MRSFIVLALLFLIGANFMDGHRSEQISLKVDQVLAQQTEIIRLEKEISRKLDVCAPVVAAQIDHESRTKRRP